MKTIASLILFLIGIVDCEQSGSQKLNGIFNDINTSESIILYSCKDAINEAYSSGNLYIYDINKRESTVISKISNMEYSIKSFFKDNDSIVICTPYEVSIYNINSGKNSRSIMKFSKKSYLISSKKIESKLELIALNNSISALELYELDVNKMTVKKTLTIKVDIIPSDNFFDVISLNKENITLENGFLYKLKDEIKTPLNIEVVFNTSLGKYVIGENKNILCCVTENKDGTRSAILISDNGIKTLPIVINKNIDQISIDESTNDNGFYLRIEKDIYHLKPDGDCKKSVTELLFSGRKININKSSNYEFEVK